jgi:hypothetical protein
MAKAFAYISIPITSCRAIIIIAVEMLTNVGRDGGMLFPKALADNTLLCSHVQVPGFKKEA